MNGIAVYKGIGIGKSYNHELQEVVINNDSINETDLEDILTQLDKYKEKHRQLLESQRDDVKESVGEEESKIFDAHIEILNDPELIGHIKNNISTQKMNLVKAIDTSRVFFVNIFSQIEDPYIRERAKDIEDVTKGLINTILGIHNDALSKIEEGTIVFAKDLSPSETIQLNKYIKGIVLEDGSVTSHTAIVAKAKGIPTIVGYTGEKANDKDTVVLDGHKAKVLINPGDEILESYKLQYTEEVKKHEALKKIKNERGRTQDGHEIELFGNVGSAIESEAVTENGGFGIGLLRTEFVYMDGSNWPSEEEQTRAYKSIASKVKGDVIIRTLDIGGDKTLPYYTFEKEENPFLGLRAIRFCLKNKEIFKTQLKAILKTSAEYPVKIMFPMISKVDEIIEAKAVLHSVMKELSDLGIEYNKNIPVGMMVEIPSVVYIMDKFVPYIDFVSIGTNDLCQYTLAVDRLNPNVSYIYDAKNISILRMIHQVVEACHKADVEVGVCGELASDREAALVLVGLGVDELSVSPSMIPTIKEAILNANYENLKVESKKWID